MSGYPTNQDLRVIPCFGFTRILYGNAPIRETDSNSCVLVALLLCRLGMDHVVPAGEKSAARMANPSGLCWAVFCDLLYGFSGFPFRPRQLYGRLSLLSPR
jgi:hypothetical protein